MPACPPPVLSEDTAKLSCRTKAPDESRHPDLKVPDFAKGILPLWALGKLLCSIPQIGKHREDLLHLAYFKYFNGTLDQRSFLPNSSFLPAIFLEADA